MTFTRWVVPLDGSESAEAILPWVERLAPRFNAHVLVLGVVALGHIVPYLSSDGYVSAEVYETLIEGETSATRDYLAKVAGRLIAKGCTTTTQVVVGHPASAIIDAAGESKEETIVAMTTHGRTGLARFALGSVAGQVVRAVESPVLMVRPLAIQPQAFDSILVPLDGSATAEAVLPAIETLAPTLAARVLLLTISSGDNTEEVTYLESVSSRLSRAGVSKVDHRILSGDPAESILAFAAQEDAGLIAMATHGRSGVRHWVLGSVAEEVLHRATIPLLLVRGRHEAD